MKDSKKKELEKAVATLIRMAKKVYPALEYEVEAPWWEDVDAHIRIYCPVKYEKKISKALYDAKYRLLSKKDLFILTGFYPPNHKLQRKAS